MDQNQRLFEIAAAFPALQMKGVENESIPGITKTRFNDTTLSRYLYHGRGGVLSHGEFLILECLLNLSNPAIHTGFNLGEALRILDEGNMKALLNAIIRTYNRE